MARTVGVQVSERAQLETKYTKLIEPEIQAYLIEISNLAASGRAVSMATALTTWADRMEKVRKKGAPKGVLDALQNSRIPLFVASVVVEQVEQGFVEKWSKKLLKRKLRAQLGLYNVAKGIGIGGRIRDLISKPTVEGTLGKMMTRDGSTLNWVSEAKRVARTNATRDFSNDMMEFFASEGYEYKRWSTRYDERVRPTHRAADRQTVKLAEEFQVGGELLSFPGDEKGSPDETENCRCTLIGVNFTEGGLEPNWDWEPALVASLETGYERVDNS